MIKNWEERAKISLPFSKYRVFVNQWDNYSKEFWEQRFLRSYFVGDWSYREILPLVVIDDSAFLDIILGLTDWKEEIQKNIDLLIDIAIECDSHECYILLVEYKRKHNLYQETDWSL